MVNPLLGVERLFTQTLFDMFFREPQEPPVQTPRPTEETPTTSTVRKLALSVTKSLGELCVKRSSWPIFYPLATFTLSMRKAHLLLRQREDYEALMTKAGGNVQHFVKLHSLSTDSTVCGTIPQKITEALSSHAPRPLSPSKILLAVFCNTARFGWTWTVRSVLFGAVPYYASSLLLSQQNNLLKVPATWIVTVLSLGLLFKAHINDVVKGLEETSNRPNTRKLTAAECKAIRKAVKVLTKKTSLVTQFKNDLKELEVPVRRSPFSSPPGKLQLLLAAYNQAKTKRDKLVEGRPTNRASKKYMEADEQLREAFLTYLGQVAEGDRERITRKNYKEKQAERNSILGTHAKSASVIFGDRDLCDDEKIIFLKACFRVNQAAIDVYKLNEAEHTELIKQRETENRMIECKLSFLCSQTKREILDSDEEGPGAGAGAARADTEEGAGAGAAAAAAGVGTTTGAHVPALDLESLTHLFAQLQAAAAAGAGAGAGAPENDGKTEEGDGGKNDAIDLAVTSDDDGANQE